MNISYFPPTRKQAVPHLQSVSVCEQHSQKLMWTDFDEIVYVNRLEDWDKVCNC